MTDEMRIGWRREQLSPPDDAGEPRLIAAIRAEIDQKGPITFARFMQRALYEPGLGYYATSAKRTTRGGDFVTAPELHPVFGQTLALVADEMWRRLGRPSPFGLREYGAGSGALFLAMLDGLVRAKSDLAEEIRYQPVDLDVQASLIDERINELGHGKTLDPQPGDTPLTGLVLANEFVDALPVHRVVRQAGELRELYVEWRQGQFVETAAELSDDRLAGWFEEQAVELREGQLAEVNLEMLNWLDELARVVHRGYVVIVDYGAGSAELYGEQRQSGTLRAFSGNQVSADVLGGAGGRDITAHVNFDVLEDRARRAGFVVLDRRRAAEFLIAGGLDEVYSAARADADRDWQSALELRAAIRRLLDTRGLGGYLVSVLGRDVPPGPPLRELADAG